MSDTLAAVDLRRVEEVGLNALQTQRQLFYDGWLLRISPGKARRARSVNAHFGSTLPLADKIAYCERLYREHHLPVLFRMTPFVQPPGLAEALAARGYVAFDPTCVQVAQLDRPPIRRIPRALRSPARPLPRSPMWSRCCRTPRPRNAMPITSGWWRRRRPVAP